MGTDVFLSDKNELKLTVVTAEPCEYTKNY